MEDNHFVCSASDCNLRFSTENSLLLHRKRHDMVLSLSKHNVPSTDQTPTPVRFIRQCEEIGLFQDLQNVNPFEETFRKAAEAVKKGSTPKTQNLSILTRTTSDDLHTPHIFPNEINIDDNMGDKHKESTLEEEVVRTEADTSLKATTAIQHLSPPVSNDRVSTTMTVTDPVVKGRGCLLDSVSTDNTIRIAAAPPAFTNLISDGTFPATADPVQVLLRMPNGSLVQLATKPVTAPIVPINLVPTSSQLDQTPKILPRTNTTGGTVILATQDFQRPAETNVSPNLTTKDVKQKLKQLLGSTSKVTKPSNPTQKIISNVNKSDSISTKKISKNDSDNNLDESEKEKRRKILERNRKAAIRCRERRKRWVEELRKRANSMAVTNRALNDEIRSLKVEVANLRALLLNYANCPVTLAQTSSQENICPPSNRNEIASKRPRRDGFLSLDIEQATRVAVLHTTIELDTPTPTLVRSDKVLSSVAPPATPEQDRLVTFTDILPQERTNEINDEIVEDRHLTSSAVMSGGTTVIQINPNVVRTSHAFS